MDERSEGSSEGVRTEHEEREEGGDGRKGR